MREIRQFSRLANRNAKFRSYFFRLFRPSRRRAKTVGEEKTGEIAAWAEATNGTRNFQCLRFSRAFVIYKSKDNYPIIILEKLIDYVEI